MTGLIRRISEAARVLRQKRVELAAASEANSEAVRRIHRAGERIGRGCTCHADQDRAGPEFIDRARRAGAAE